MQLVLGRLQDPSNLGLATGSAKRPAFRLRTRETVKTATCCHRLSPPQGCKKTPAPGPPDVPHCGGDSICPHPGGHCQDTRTASDWSAAPGVRFSPAGSQPLSLLYKPRGGGRQQGPRRVRLGARPTFPSADRCPPHCHPSALLRPLQDRTGQTTAGQDTGPEGRSLGARPPSPPPSPQPGQGGWGARRLPGKSSFPLPRSCLVLAPRCSALGPPSRCSQSSWGSVSAALLVC